VGMKGGLVAAVDTRQTVNATRTLAVLPTPAPVFCVLPLPANSCGAAAARSHNGVPAAATAGGDGGGAAAGVWDWAADTNSARARSTAVALGYAGVAAGDEDEDEDEQAGGSREEPRAAGGTGHGCIELLASSTTGAWGVGKGCVRPLDGPVQLQGSVAKHTCESLALGAAAGVIAVSWRTPMGTAWGPGSTPPGMGAYHNLFVAGCGSSGAADAAAPAGAHAQGSSAGAQDAPLRVRAAYWHRLLSRISCVATLAI
jgi:hypothetical protein